MLQTVEKAAQVLYLFTPERPEWGVSEVAARMGLPRSSAHAFLSTLAEVGLLHRLITGRYRLGFRLLSLSQSLLQNTSWREAAAQEMEKLRQTTGETVQLAVMAGGKLITVLQLSGVGAGYAEVGPVGSMSPPYCTAPGKMLLALRPWVYVEGVLDQHGFGSLTANTIVSRDELRSELLRIRQRGYAYDIEEFRAGQCCVAAPVQNQNGETIVSLGLTAPGERFHARKEALREAVVSAATRISQQIGFNPEFRQASDYWWTSVEGRDELQPARPIHSKRPMDMLLEAELSE